MCQTHLRQRPCIPGHTARARPHKGGCNCPGWSSNQHLRLPSATSKPTTLRRTHTLNRGPVSVPGGDASTRRINASQSQSPADGREYVAAPRAHDASGDGPLDNPHPASHKNHLLIADVRLIRNLQPPTVQSRTDIPSPISALRRKNEFMRPRTFREMKPHHSPKDARHFE